MSRIKNILVAFIFVGLVNICTADGQLPHEKLSYPEISFEIPDMHTEKLASGAELFYLSDEGSAVVRVAFYVPGGRHRDPLEKAGLSALLSAVQRSGGTVSVPADKLDEELETLGAEINAESQTMYNVVEMRCLRRDFERVAELFFAILQNPAFAENRFETEKRNTLDGIKRRDDDPGTLARRKLVAVAYKGHPHGYEDTIKSVSAITRDDLLRAHGRRFRPEGSEILVVGDISLAEFKAVAEKHLQKWPRNSLASVAPVAEVPLDFQGERFFVEKENPQIKIRIGHKSVTMDNPDYIPLQVMNYILGGGSFNSRMVKEVRTEMGLAYSVYSRVSADKFYGLFECSCDTGFETASKALKQIFINIDRIRTEEVKPEELQLATDALINSFVFRFVTRWQVGRQMLFYRQRGLPEDYLQKYLEQVRQVTAADVLRVAAEYLHPQDMKMVMVGPFSSVREEMEEHFGAFAEIKID
jgi:predicted Zn-dependent peptidase